MCSFSRPLFSWFWLLIKWRDKEQVNGPSSPFLVFCWRFIPSGCEVERTCSLYRIILFHCRVAIHGAFATSVMVFKTWLDQMFKSNKMSLYAKAVKPNPFTSVSTLPKNMVSDRGSSCHLEMLTYQYLAPPTSNFFRNYPQVCRKSICIHTLHTFKQDRNHLFWTLLSFNAVSRACPGVKVMQNLLMWASGKTMANGHGSHTEAYGPWQSLSISWGEVYEVTRTGTWKKWI